jgi:hypothetical protein
MDYLEELQYLQGQYGVVKKKMHNLREKGAHPEIIAEHYQQLAFIQQEINRLIILRAKSHCT